MRRLFGCFFMLLLVAAVFLTLLARGPGLQGLPIPVDLEPPIGGQTPTLAPGSTPETQFPTRSPATPTEQPTTVSLPPTETVVTPPTPTEASGTIVLTVRLHGPAGEALDTVIDGNAVGLTAEVANSTQAAFAGTVSFSLVPLDTATSPFASCPLEVAPGGQASCTVWTAADGWAWQDHQPLQRRTVYATLIGPDAATTVEVPVRPKPVVLVHGFTSSAATWSAWSSPDGFLAHWGIAGYAVGDGQFGVEPMDTGAFTQPRRPTNSIAENAAIVARYVDAVRQATGAERVDLVAHSMGGLISRYYVSHFMPLVERQGLPTVPAANQLYMIGTPNGGTPCAIPPAMLGLYSPATTELTPTYMQYLFNPQTSDHRGVPFFVLAGDPVRDFVALVCTPIPTDAFVSVGSAAGAIPVAAQTMPVRHGQQTGSPEVFAAVLQSLSRGPQEYPIPIPTAPAVAPADFASLQMTLVDSGTLPAKGLATLDVTLDEAEQASFQLYAPDQNVDLSIVSSVGRPITSDTAKTAPDISTEKTDGREGTATQSFKVQKPEAGRWQLILKPQAGVKAEGAFYAVAAFLQSDLRLTVDTPLPVVSAGQPVTIRATLSGPVALKTASARATVRDAHGNPIAEATLFDDGAHDDGQVGDGILAGAWPTSATGLYSIAVAASGKTTAGNAFQRLGLLAVEVR